MNFTLILFDQELPAVVGVHYVRCIKLRRNGKLMAFTLDFLKGYNEKCKSVLWQQCTDFNMRLCL